MWRDDRPVACRCPALPCIQRDVCLVFEVEKKEHKNIFASMGSRARIPEAVWNEETTVVHDDSTISTATLEGLYFANLSGIIIPTGRN